eukprot:TRINITY_DN3868_c0_g1_i1.p1 TRINITY_DN3868_c0_g1~~TRINITY_DN3868_c0_g1_i1.p1  ORF type:complete len:119 (+),score=14.21 TRINITY_DN3868_c0_g1_i1:28-357(+)
MIRVIKGVKLVIDQMCPTQPHNKHHHASTTKSHPSPPLRKEKWKRSKRKIVVPESSLTSAKSEHKLSASSRVRKVPKSRTSRVMHFGGLFAGMGVGAVSEGIKVGSYCF